MEKLRRFSRKLLKSEIQSLLELICFPRLVANINNMIQIVQNYKLAEFSLETCRNNLRLETFLDNLFYTFKHH